MKRPSVARGDLVATLEIRLHGEITVLADGKVRKLPQSRKTRALLAYLIATGRAHNRRHLSSLLWEGSDDPRGGLRWGLSRLRALVDVDGKARIVSDGDEVAFDPDGVDVDVIRVRDALRRGTSELDTTTLLALADAQSRELMEGLELGDCHAFAAWCLAQREDARRRQRMVLDAVMERLADEPTRAIPYARELVRIEPADEALRARLVHLLAGAGRLREARDQCQASERLLRELGLRPTGALAEAWQSLTAPAPAPANPPPPSEVRASGRSHPVPLLGRQDEWRCIADVLAEVRSRRRRHMLLVTGEPGVGKTRLVSDALHRLAPPGEAVILRGRAFEAERGRPYGPWMDALADRRVAKGRPSPLFPDPGVAEETPNTASQRQIFDDVKRWLADLCTETGVVVSVIDDVQWLDDASAELLHYVAREITLQPVLFVLIARGGELDDNEAMQRVLRSLRRQEPIPELPVGPLSRDDTAALVGAAAPGCDVDRIFELSAGNPLFALELARSDPRPGAALPGTLTGAIRGRIERLSPDAADLLRWASALGPVVPVARLEALTSLRGQALMAATEQLERHVLLQAEGPAYHFSHDVVRQVVYGELSEPRRRLMHGQIANALDAEGGSDESRASEIARHASLAGNASMAVRACVAAAKRSNKMFAQRDAMALVRHAEIYLSQLAEPERTTAAIDLWAVRLGAEGPGDAQETARELETLADRAIDLGALQHARLCFQMLGSMRWEAGWDAHALSHALDAEMITRGAQGVVRVDALAEAARCMVLLDRDLEQAEALVLEARALAERHALETAMLSMAEGMLRAHHGALDQAVALLSTARNVARRNQDHLAEFSALEQLTMIELQRGNVRDARALCDRMQVLGDRVREGSEGPCAHALSAITRYACGEAGARAALDVALRELEVVDAKYRLIRALLITATLEIERGEYLDVARERAREALRLAEIMERRSDAACARALLVRATPHASVNEGIATDLDAQFTTQSSSLAGYARQAILDALQDKKS